MSQTENTPPAFFKAPTVTPTAEVFKALLVYQRARDAFKESTAGIKRTKAGNLREADKDAYVEAERVFHRDGAGAYDVIHDWGNEVAEQFSGAYYQSLAEAFLAYANSREEAKATRTIQALNGLIAAEGRGIAGLFAGITVPEWVEVRFGTTGFKVALRLENPGVASIDFYELGADGRHSGFTDFSAKMHYKNYNDTLRNPMVKYASVECNPDEAENYADLVKEVAILARTLTCFNNNEVGVDYDIHRHRYDKIEEALTVRHSSITYPRNPDAE
jgi:hypothetical protein